MSKAKKSCPAVPANACQTSVVEASLRFDPTCEGKTAIISRLMAALQRDVQKGRISGPMAQKLLMQRVKGVELTCRNQGVRMRKQEAVEKAIAIAKEEKAKAEAINFSPNRHNRGYPVNGLFGLGIFGL